MSRLPLHQDLTANPGWFTLSASGPGSVGRGVIIGVSAMAACLITWAALEQPKAVSAMAVMGVIGVAAWLRPALMLCSVFALAPFQNDLSLGGPLRFSIAELNLALITSILLMRSLTNRQPIGLGPLAWPVAAYCVAAVISLLLSGMSRSGIVSIMQVVLYLCVAVSVFGAVATSPRIVLFVLKALIGVTLILAIAVLVTRSNYVMGLHKNGIGASLASGFVVALALHITHQTRRRWLWVAIMATLGLGLLITLSRGAWMATILSSLVLLAWLGRWGYMLRLGLGLLVIGFIASLILPEQALDYATDFNSKLTNIRARIDSASFAWGEFQKAPIFGVGLGLRKDYDATNLLLLTLGETGLVGLIGLVWLVAGSLWLAYRLKDRVAPGTVKHRDLPKMIGALAAALLIGRLCHGMVDHFWTRGPTLLVWATIGMALGMWRASVPRKDPAAASTHPPTGRPVVTLPAHPRISGDRGLSQ
ncbi:MAG: O-antigen ligase family protein [Planctomycetota bacterium]